MTTRATAALRTARHGLQLHRSAQRVTGFELRAGAKISIWVLAFLPISEVSRPGPSSEYIQGFTDIAGNLPGQGSTWSWVFRGVEIPTVFSLPTTVATARSSARLIALSPPTWMSASDPAVFGRREVIVKNRASGRSYTPADTVRLLQDAGLDSIKPIVEHYLGFVKFAQPKYFPDVDVAAEKGSGLATQVGIDLPDLTSGQVVNPATADLIILPGDSNQEYITNDAVSLCHRMHCYRFRLTDNPGVSHLG